MLLLYQIYIEKSNLTGVEKVLTNHLSLVFPLSLRINQRTSQIAAATKAIAITHGKAKSKIFVILLLTDKLLPLEIFKPAFSPLLGGRVVLGLIG